MSSNQISGLLEFAVFVLFYYGIMVVVSCVFSLEFPNKATKGKKKRDRKFNTIKKLTLK